MSKKGYNSLMANIRRDIAAKQRDAKNPKAQWKLEFIALVDACSNLELFELFVVVTEPDDYDGEFTPRGAWKRAYVEKKLRERLGDWLTADGGERVNVLEI